MADPLCLIGVFRSWRFSSSCESESTVQNHADTDKYGNRLGNNRGKKTIDQASSYGDEDEENYC